MKAVRWVACLLLAVATSGCSESDSGLPLRSGQDEVAGLSDLDGRPIDTSGKVLLVNYWAEWCKPCREEIPELNRVARSEDIVVVGVNFDLPEARENRAQAQKMGIEFPLLLDEPIGRWGRPRPDVLPATFVIGADGRWRETLYGPQTLEKLEAAVKRSRQ